MGKPKAEICKEIIESHNPFTVVESYDLDVTGHSEELQRIAREADLIIGASGSVRINNILNGLSIKMKKPSLYGGAFEKGRGGLVLAVRPFEGPCFNCIFGLASQLYSVDKESAQSYGLNEDELHQQQGLWIDVSFPALVLAKMAVAMLQDTELDYNLVVYDNDLEIRKLKAKRRDDCAVCNFEGWRRAQLKQSVFSKARQWLTRTRADGL